MRLLGDTGALRIDHDQPGAAFARLLDDAREVQVGNGYVVAPDSDEVGVSCLLRRHSRCVAEQAGIGRAAHAAAKRTAIEQRGAQFMEKAPVHGTDRELSVRTRVVKRQYRLRPVGFDRLLRAFGDQLERLVPADRPEFTAARRAAAQQGFAQTLLAVHEIGVVLRNLVANRARGVGIHARASHLADLVVLYGNLQRTGVGTIERANRGFDQLFVYFTHVYLRAGWASAPTSFQTATCAPYPAHRSWRRRASFRECPVPRATRRRESSTRRYPGFYP